MDRIDSFMLKKVVRLVVAKNKCSIEDAEDALQDAIVRTIPVADRVKDMTGWLIRAAQHSIIDMRRREDHAAAYRLERYKTTAETMPVGVSFEGEKHSEILVALAMGKSKRDVAEHFGLGRYVVNKILVEWLCD